MGRAEKEELLNVTVIEVSQGETQERMVLWSQ